MSKRKLKSSRELSQRIQSRMSFDEKLSCILTLLDIAVLPEAADVKKIQESLSNERVPLSDIRKLRAWLLARFPDVYYEIHGKERGGLRLLIDENSPYSLGHTLASYGYVSSVVFEGWRGKKDQFMYGYAWLKGKFDAVISDDKKRIKSRKDRDLTLVVEDVWLKSQKGHKKPQIPEKRPPVLISLPSNAPYRDGTVKTFESHQSVIQAMIESRQHAVISVTPVGVFEMSDMRLRDIWLRANELVVNEADRPAPTIIAKAVKQARRRAAFRNVSISTLANIVKHRSGDAYHKRLQSGGELTTEDILDLFDAILDEIKSDADQDQLALLEDVNRAIRHEIYGPEVTGHPFNGDGYFNGVPVNAGGEALENV